MPNFTAGTSFTDGVTNDVTAAKLNALIADAVPTSSLSLNSTTGTIANFNSSTANITNGTITNLTNGTTAGTVATFTTGTLTTGVIPTLTSTTLITSGTGTAASPAIQPTGDTNTGIFFPAADTIAFSEGGTEAMRIDSSGNVGIGTTSPSSFSGKLVVNTGTNKNITNRGSVRLSGSTIQSIQDNASTDSPLEIYTGASQLQLEGNPITFYNNGERLRIDSSGNVLVNTTANDTGAKLEVKQAASGTGFGVQAQGNDNPKIQLRLASGSTGVGGEITSNGGLVLSTSNTERLRITSGGEVCVAGATDQGAYNLQVNGTGVWGAGAYVNGSDERLKENIQDITSGLDVVEKLRPVSFQYKENYTADRSVQSGFIAQDLLVALDGKNYLEGVVSQGPTYYNVAYQNLIPILAKAIQELKAENDSLKARIEILEVA